MTDRAPVLSLLTVLGMLFATIKCDKLSSNQKAPIYASSAGGLSLALPKSGGGSPSAVPSADGVIHEIMESFKTEGKEFIRVVSGKVGYTSPEGLPISIKYMADENGNRASFTIGNPRGGSGGSLSQGGGSQSRLGGGSGFRNGAAKPSGARGGLADSYLPPNQNNKDRSYLPPTKS